MVSLEHLFKGDLRVVEAGIHEVGRKSRPAPVHDLVGGHHLPLVQARVQAEGQGGKELRPLVPVPFEELADVGQQLAVHSLDLAVALRMIG